MHFGPLFFKKVILLLEILKDFRHLHRDVWMIHFQAIAYISVINSLLLKCHLLMVLIDVSC